MAIGDILNIQLETITSGGDALGRINGKPVFVAGGAPDETIHCRIVEDKNSWARGELLEIIEPSPVRVKTTCAFYGKCGGCNLAHIDYNAQLAAKTAILKDSFVRIGGFQPPEPLVFSSQPWEYRNRMQFHCLRQAAKAEDIGFGLKGRASGEIITVSDCPIAVPEIREILIPPSLHASSASLRLCEKSFQIPPEKDRFTVFAKDNVLLNEGGQQKGKIKLLEKEITVDASLFFQSNCFMLEKLIVELQKIAQNADRGLPMADLYCGVGTFALFLGGLFPKLVLAEENKAAVSLARENLRGLNADFFALRDTEWPEHLFHKWSGKPEHNICFAVVDPPRAGLTPKLAATLAKDGPSVLAYVSCDPASLARDSKTLTSGGYKLKQLNLFDFYPQTAHIESLAVFER